MINSNKLQKNKNYRYLAIFIILMGLLVVSAHASAETKMTVSPSGDIANYRAQELRRFEHSGAEPTGYFMKKGDTLTINAKGVTNAKVLLGLFGTYSTLNGGEANAFEKFDLKNGENTFTMSQEIGQVYIENSSEDQSIEVTIDGGRRNPIYRIGETSDEDFINQLKEYSDAPFFELVGDKGMCLLNMDDSNINALKKRASVKSLVEYLDQVVESEAKANGLFYGSDNSLGVNQKHNNRVLILESDQVGSAGFAVNNYVSFGADMVNSFLNWKAGDNLWGFWHEIGHTFQNPYMMWTTDGDTGIYPGYSLSEVTVNINAIYIQHLYGTGGHFDDQDKHRQEIQQYLKLSDDGKDFDTTSTGDFKPDTDTSVWLKVAFFNQIMLAYGYNVFASVNQEYRLMYASGEQMPKTNEEQRQCFMKILSQVTQRNLTKYFEKWGLHPNKQVQEEMGKYPEPSVPIEDNLIPGQETPIVDNVVNEIQIPTGKVKKTKYILGAQSSDFDSKDLFDNTTFKNQPSGDSIEPSFNIITTNDLLENSGLKVKITNQQGQSNLYEIPVDKSYGNAISMTAYASEERAIFTLQRSTQTIETFTKESQKTVLNSGTDQFVDFKLYDKNGNLKIEKTCNENEAPQDFVHSLRGVKYEEGDVVALKMLQSGKLQSYKDGEIDLTRADSSKDEYFNIQNDQFIRVEAEKILSGESLTQNINIGAQIPNASSLVKNVDGIFGKENIDISYTKNPSLIQVGPQNVSILLKDKTTGQTKAITSILNVQYSNSLALAGYLATDVRSVLRLDSETQKIVGVTDPDRTSSISSSTNKYWEVKILRNGAVVKDVTANGSDTPVAFTNSLNGTDYQEGDLVYIYAYQKFIQNYQNNQLMSAIYDTDNNYFRITNNQFVKVDSNDDDFEIGQTHLLYENDEALDEAQMMKEAKVTVGDVNNLTSNFDANLSKELGDHTVEITSTNSLTGESTTKEVVISIVNPSSVIDGKLQFTDDEKALTIGQEKAVNLDLNSNTSSITSAEDIHLEHQFNSNVLQLGNTIQIMNSEDEWQTQTIDPKEALHLEFSQLKPTESQSVKYNIIANSKVNLKAGDVWKITYSYTNESGDVRKKYTKTKELSLDIVTKESDGPEDKKVISKGTISFKDDTTPTQPVDPVNPEQPVDPISPINPNGAELMITYASDLNFGVQPKSGKVWHALADTVNGDEGNGQREVVPFVSVKDSRGTQRQGWKLEVTKDNDFRDTKGNVLKGAALKLSDLNFADQENSPIATPGELEINNVASVIASADSSQGSGVTSLALGHLKEIDDSIGKMNKTSGVTLDILPGTKINSDTYTTSITYELVAGV